MLAGQTPADRPDLCARVFNLKLNEFLNDLTRGHVLGAVKAFRSIIEFQKRGLPHAHILIILDHRDKLTTPAHYDSVISAQLPDKDAHPALWQIVSSCMVHGPCGHDNPNNVCMKDGNCSKGFPKPFCPATHDRGDGYPEYKRLEDGRHVLATVRPTCCPGHMTALTGLPWKCSQSCMRLSVDVLFGFACLQVRDLPTTVTTTAPAAGQQPSTHTITTTTKTVKNVTIDRGADTYVVNTVVTTSHESSDPVNFPAPTSTSTSTTGPTLSPIPAHVVCPSYSITTNDTTSTTTSIQLQGRAAVTKITTRSERQVALDNRWVVPYNPVLSLKYNAHINVEYCATIHAVKYLHKYIYKGSDRAMVAVTEWRAGEAREEIAERDEIKLYIDGRYTSASEACWRLFCFNLHEEGPTVEPLAIHLPNQQMVLLRPDANLAQVAAAGPPPTTLTAWFDLNNDPVLGPIARQYLYHDIPTYFTWVKAQKCWTLRRGLGNKRLQVPPIGRMYFISPTAGELFYLRLLLTNVPGARGYDDLLTFNNTCYPTFQAAATARGLLEDDSEVITCLQEAREWQMPAQLRSLFATFLAYGRMADPAALWTAFRDDMLQDFLLRDFNITSLQHLPNTAPPETVSRLEHEAFMHINELLRPHNLRLQSIAGFEDFNPAHVPRGPQAERRRYDYNAMRTTHDANHAKLNVEQRAVYDEVMAAVQHARSHGPVVPALIFVDSPGGCGKTFTFNTILAAVRLLDNGIALAVASSGIAALLLDGGSTAHSRFKIPIPLGSDSLCNLPVNSPAAELIRSADLIVWDEAPMAHR